MASPQLENGHTRIANELLRSIYRFPFSANGLRIVLWVMRMSYGWNKKIVDKFSIREISMETNISSSSVHLALNVLIENNVLIKDGGGHLHLNKDFDLWINNGIDPIKKVTIPSELRKKVFERDNYSCKNCGNTENISIDHIIPESSGGKCIIENLQTLCISCNKSKGSRLDWIPNGVHPTGQSTIKKVSSPLDKSVQPTGRSFLIVKEKKEIAKIVPPKLDWVKEYIIEKGYKIDPQSFFDHYEARGWKPKGYTTKMSNWKAAIRTWSKNDFQPVPKPKDKSNFQDRIMTPQEEF